MNATELSVSFLPYRDNAERRIIPESWDRLELVRAWTLVACVPVGSGMSALVNSPELRELVTVRWKMSRSGDGASPQRCAVFMLGADPYRVGYGTARGYGYCKMSAAFASALESAGVKVSADLHGTGEGMVREALLAIGKALAGDVPMIVVEG